MSADGERRKRLLRLGSALAFIAVAAVLVLIVIDAGDSGGGDAESIEGAVAIERELAGIPQDGLVLGKPGVRAKLIEFGDLQCPVCKSYAEEILPDVIESKVRAGDARLEFRSFIIINEESADAAAAAIAAGEQGRGWQFVELFYRNQGTEASGYVTDDFLTAVAEAAGVPDIQKWDARRQSRATLAQVEAETAEAQQLGLTGTPSFLVEGPSVDGGQEVLGTPGSAGDLEAAIDAAG